MCQKKHLQIFTFVSQVQEACFESEKYYLVTNQCSLLAPRRRAATSGQKFPSSRTRISPTFLRRARAPPRAPVRFRTRAASARAANRFRPIRSASAPASRASAAGPGRSRRWSGPSLSSTAAARSTRSTRGAGTIARCVAARPGRRPSSRAARRSSMGSTHLSASRRRSAAATSTTTPCNPSR